MASKKRSNGFTLLELLLVVGVAAILIIAGIVTYGLVARSIAINETVRVAQTILDQTRRLHSNMPTYGVAGTDLEPLLINSGSIPAKYINAAGPYIHTPLNKTGAAIILSSTNPGKLFNLQMVLPYSSIPEIVLRFDPRNSSEITTTVAVCGGTYQVTDASPATMGTPAIYAAMCSGNTDGSITIQSR